MIWKVELWVMVGQYPNIYSDTLLETIVNENEIIPFTYSFSHSFSSEGLHKYYVKSFDRAGNWNNSEVQEQEVIVDNKILCENGFLFACEDDSLITLG
jgi:hypothetical protein